MNLGTNLNSSKKFINEYYPILCKDYPAFLDDYINTPAMQRIAGSSISCGCNYTNLYNLKFLYTNLDHSIGVALIVWNFTKSKSQTLAGLFHDIATPTFKHAIDFMNGDHETQESTEEMTEQMISGSKEIMALLKKDNIKLDEVIDYKIYPIADNETPRLSADRLEYTFTNGVFWGSVWNLHDIQRIYRDITIAKNEDSIDELAFRSLDIAEAFIRKASTLWPNWIDNSNKVTMQFIADICKEMIDSDFLNADDLYKLSDLEVIDKIINHSNARISDRWMKFVNCTEAYSSNSLIKDKYCISVKSKQRYLDPLVTTSHGAKRLSAISKDANSRINSYLELKTTKYAYLDISN